MAAPSDKARFYLEQYVPELQEYRRKKIFSRDEIGNITSKRSDFEHTLNARGSTPADYARYATYEMNLDSLRKKRCKRVGIKSTPFNGQRTVFFVLDRATKKFPSDMGLWMQYINFCKKEQAHKKLAKVFTTALRLHPRDCSLWVLAAKHYAETQGDMGTARSYMQRGLRFCKDERKMYLEYAKLEMVYLAKLAARKKILGLDETRGEKFIDEIDDENFTALPTITAEDINPDVSKGVEEVDEHALKRLENAPAFSGAIPLAIFDAAMKQFKEDGPDVADDFFDLVASFDSVQASRRILQHVLDHLRTVIPLPSESIICEAKYEFFGVDLQSAHFPPALSKALALIRQRAPTLSDKQRSRLVEKATLLLVRLLSNTEPSKEIHDEDVRHVLRASIKRHLRTMAESPPKPGRIPGPAMLLSMLQKRGRHVEAEMLGVLMQEAGLG